MSQTFSRAGIRVLYREGFATLLAMPAGAALLAKVYGIAELDRLFVTIVVPALAVLVVTAWIWRRHDRDLALAILVGAACGFVGAVFYDIVRIPAHLAGYRVWGAISVFGLWLTDAPMSSRATEAAGWAYHYLNGMTFGVLYAVWARGRHWGWGIAWALALESLAVVTVFGDIFLLRGNPTGIAIAYAAHVPYGLALGWPLWRWEQARTQVAAMRRGGWIVAGLLALLVVFWPAWAPYPGMRDDGARPDEFTIAGPRLLPDWLRVERGNTVRIENPGDAPVQVFLPQQRHRITVPRQGYAAVVMRDPGIVQLYVETGERSRSSFVLVEPVHEVARRNRPDLESSQ